MLTTSWRRAALIVAAAVLIAAPQARAAGTIGESYGGSGGIGCSYGGLQVQTASPGDFYAAPYDGVITSWTNQGYFWSTITFKTVRLGTGGTYTVLASDGPRTVPAFNARTTYPVRFTVRQGDVIGGYIPNSNYTCVYGGADYAHGRDDANPLAGQNGFFDSSEQGQIPLEATIEHDRDGDGYGDETQDLCPTNAAAQGPCPLPTTLGQTFTPITSSTTGTSIPALPADQRFTAPADGVITSWSYAANSLVDGTAKLKVARPLGGDGFQIVGESESRAPTANTLNTFPARVSVRAGDRVGIRAENLPIASNVSASGSSWFVASDPAPGASATFTQSNRRINVSAVLEADADEDGFGDTTQDLCPTDPATQGACRSVEPPDDVDQACPKAREKLKKAKAKLKKLKKDDAKPKKVKAAKKKVKKAKKGVKKAC